MISLIMRIRALAWFRIKGVGFRESQKGSRTLLCKIVELLGYHSSSKSTTSVTSSTTSRPTDASIRNISCKLDIVTSKSRIRKN